MKRPYQIDPRPCLDFIWPAESTTVEQLLDQLRVMRRMEATTYRRRDYLYGRHSPYNEESSCSYDDIGTGIYIPVSQSAINETTRQSMIDLLMEIGDYCHFRRDTVAYAIWNLMDRYLSLPSHTPLHTQADWQLLASACLFIAVKLLEPVSMDVTSLADLSRGQFEAAHVLQMERRVLAALNWTLSHGPTPIGFVQLYLTLLQRQHGLDLDTAEALWEQASYQVELSVVEYQLVVSRHVSEIALAAVWNALECQLEGHQAQQCQQQLLQLLPHAPTKSLPKIQLALCKLQYTAEAHYQERQQQSQQPQALLVPEEPSCCEQRDDDLQQLPAAVDCETLDETETLEADESPSRYLFPSPVSVATELLLSAQYSEKEQEVKPPPKESYGFSSYLKSLFF